jgi:diguanylate cyclase (GGDEF)-like protein
MEFQHYLRMLQRGWWIIALTALSALSIALAASYFAEPVYESRAQFIVSPNASLSGTESIYGLDALNKRSIVTTYAEVLRSSRIYYETGTALQMDDTELGAYSHSAVVLPEANILELAVKGPNPEKAALLANTLGQRTINYIRGLYPAYDINFLALAGVPSNPISPHPLRDATIATILGLALGVAFTLLLESVVAPFMASYRRPLFGSMSPLFSRGRFEESLERELNRPGLESLSLGIVELDSAGDLLDSLPRPVFQQLMQEVSRVLHEELRGKDVIARWDQTRYAVLLPGVAGTQATRTLEYVQRALSVPLVLDLVGEPVHLSPQLGVATTRTVQPAELLVERAEMALERAREKGIKTVFFSADLQAATA